ncbi:hypothetical protein ACFSBS_23350 [Azospirillum griseum]
MSTVENERDRRRAALTRFWEQNRSELKSIRQWAAASDLGYNTLNEFVRNKKNKNMLADTYEKLAFGASKLLQREVTIHELLNEDEKNDSDDPRLQKIDRILDLLKRLSPQEQDAFEVILEARVKASSPS